MNRGGDRAKQEAKTEFSFTLLKTLLDICSPEAFKQSVFCYRHSCMCPVRQDPRDFEHRGQVYTVNTAGSTCIAHSSMGKRGGLIDPTIIPFAIWCAERLHTKESLILHECTAHHPSETVFERLFGSAYAVLVYKICPSMLGFGCKRIRKFTVLVRKDVLLNALPVFRTPVCMFQAPAKFLGSGYFVDETADMGSLSIGDLSRLREHIKLITDSGYSGSDDFLVDVTQAVGFTAVQRLVPCLLRRAKIYSLRRKRLLTGWEARRGPTLGPTQASFQTKLFEPIDDGFKQSCFETSSAGLRPRCFHSPWGLLEVPPVGTHEVRN